MKKGQSSGDQAKGVAKAKDDEINTLRAEGTNLSLKILSLESALKKYRASKKEDDASLASLREKLTQAEALLEKRNDRVKQLEFSEKKYLGESLEFFFLLSSTLISVFLFITSLANLPSSPSALFLRNYHYDEGCIRYCLPKGGKKRNGVGPGSEANSRLAGINSKGEGGRAGRPVGAVAGKRHI